MASIQPLEPTCSIASGCAQQWQIVGAADVNKDGHVDLTWFNRTTGQVVTWLLDGKGNSIGSRVLTPTCSAASGCSAAWRPLGYVTFP